MSILITGGSGFVGSALTKLLLEKGYQIYSVSRHPPEKAGNLVPLEGDITKPDLGLRRVPSGISALYHLAGIHSLGGDNDGSIWRTNVLGTNNVVEFCLRHRIPRLYFTSTAYTWKCNPYGLSKIKNEEVLKDAQGLKVTIFKPSIIMGTEEHPYPGHFSQFVLSLIKIHKRAEVIRRRIEGTLRLPVIEPVFRIKGDPQGKLNLVTVDAVAEAIARIKKVGTFWLTNPAPPTLQQLCNWVGEYIMVRLKIEPDKFKPMPLELTFQKMAGAFEPYLWGDDFPSDLKGCPQISREFIHDTIRRTLLSKS